MQRGTIRLPHPTALALLVCSTFLPGLLSAAELRSPTPILPPGIGPCPAPVATAPVPDRPVDAPLAATLRSALETALPKAPSQPRGLSVAVLVPERGCWTIQQGDAAPGRRVTADTRFHAGSSGKLVTAALAAAASADGSLDLACPLGTDSGLPPEWAPIRLGQLLNHTGGVGSFDENPAYDRFAPADPGDLIALTPTKLDATPGSAHRYSNTGYILLGLALEQSTGHPWSELVRTRLFAPIPGCTALTADQCREGTMAVGFLSGQPLPFLADYRNVFSCGGIIARPLDLARLYEGILQGRLISPQATAILLDSMAPVAAPPVAVWAGRGINRVDTPKESYLLHGGAIPGFRTIAGISRDTGVTVAIMANDNEFTPDPLLFALCEAAARHLGEHRTGLERWRERNFGRPENAGPGADDACPHGDGVCNLLKYALNLQADRPDFTRMKPHGTKGTPLIDTDALGRITLTFVRRLAATAPGISYEVLFSDDLASWRPNPSAQVAIAPIDETFERMVVTDSIVPEERARRFARLQVSRDD